MGRHFMTLASGGAGRASQQVSARPVPGRRTGSSPFTPLWTGEGRPAYLADRPCYRQLASVRWRIQRYGHGTGEDLLVDDEGHRGEIEQGKRRDGKPDKPLSAFRALLDDPPP